MSLAPITFTPSNLERHDLRVLFLTNMWPDAERPHYGTFVHSQATSLERQGVAIDTLAIRGYTGRSAYIAAVPAIRRTIRERTYDVVHAHTGHTASIALPCRPRRFIISYVGGDLLGHPHESGITRKSRLEVAVFRHMARAAAATITKSQEMEEVLPSSARRRNHVIPNGVDLERFDPRPMSVARQHLGWKDDEVVALFLGDPRDPRKNIELATAAVDRVRAAGQRVRLHVGWGSPPEEVPWLMWASDCLVMPSRSEGSPNVVKEAMAATLPIVASPVGDVEERFAGVAGCFIAPLEAEAFADALTRALEHGRTKHAREAVRPLAIEVVAARIAELYGDVIRKR